MKKYIIKTKTKLNKFENYLKDLHIFNPLINNKGMELVQALGLMALAVLLLGVVLFTVESDSIIQMNKIKNSIASIYKEVETSADTGKSDISVDQSKIVAKDTQKLGGQVPSYYAKATDGLCTYVHSVDGTVHSLTGNGENVKFYSNGEWKEGDSLKINGKTAKIYNLLGENIENYYLFETGVIVNMSIRYIADQDIYNCYFELNGEGGSSSGRISVYTVNYILNGGKLIGIQGDSSYYTSETETFDLPSAKRDKWDTFNGWYENSDFTGSPLTQIVKGSRGNKTLYAKYNEGMQIDWSSGVNRTTSGGGNIASLGKGNVLLGAAGTTNGNSWVYAEVSKTVNTKNYNKLFFEGWYNEGNYGTGYVVVSANGSEIKRWNINQERGSDYTINFSLDVSAYDEIKITVAVSAEGAHNTYSWGQIQITDNYLMM